MHPIYINGHASQQMHYYYWKYPSGTTIPLAPLWPVMPLLLVLALSLVWAICLGCLWWWRILPRKVKFDVHQFQIAQHISLGSWFSLSTCLSLVISGYVFCLFLEVKRDKFWFVGNWYVGLLNPLIVLHWLPQLVHITIWSYPVQ